MKKKAKNTPAPFDLAAALVMKAKARKYRSKLSFGEKIERMEALRERLRPLKEAREARRKKTGSTAFRK
jgi:hypothetical protein